MVVEYEGAEDEKAAEEEEGEEDDEQVEETLNKSAAVHRLEASHIHIRHLTKWKFGKDETNTQQSRAKFRQRPANRYCIYCIGMQKGRHRTVYTKTVVYCIIYIYIYILYLYVSRCVVVM